MHYLLDVLRVRTEYPGLKRFVVEMRDHYRADAVLIEDQGSGASLIQDLRHEGTIHPIAITPHGDKITRMYTVTAKLEAGTVSIPREATWLDDFRMELLQFPRGRYDDQVDSVSQYLNWAKTHRLIDDAPCFVVESRVAREWTSEFGPPDRLCLPKTLSATGTVSIRNSADSIEACEPSLACCSLLSSRGSNLGQRLRRNSSRFVISLWWFNGVGRLVRD
jgi:predicted phage terminase large subunit-like protein